MISDFHFTYDIQVTLLNLEAITRILHVLLKKQALLAVIKVILNLRKNIFQSLKYITILAVQLWCFTMQLNTWGSYILTINVKATGIKATKSFIHNEIDLRF